MMDLLDYLATSSDQPYRPDLPAFEPHPLRRPDFTREFEALLTDQLVKKGVSLADLQCHELKFWHPPADQMDPVYLWLRKSEWDAERILYEQMARADAGYIMVGHVNGWRATQYRGADDMVLALSRAASQQSCLAVWALAGLVPLVKVHKAAPDYVNTSIQAAEAERDKFGFVKSFSLGPEVRRKVGFTSEESWELACDLLGQHVSDVPWFWDSRHRQALPTTNIFPEGYQGRRPSERSIGTVDYIAGVMAATLHDYLPVVIQFVLRTAVRSSATGAAG